MCLAELEKQIICLTSILLAVTEAAARKIQKIKSCISSSGRVLS